MLRIAQNIIPFNILLLILVEIGVCWSLSWLSTYAWTLQACAARAVSYHCVLGSFAVCTAQKASCGQCSWVLFAFLPTLWSLQPWLLVSLASPIMHVLSKHVLTLRWPIPRVGAQWGAPAVLGKLVLHPVPRMFETDRRDLHWLGSVSPVLQPWPASHTLRARWSVAPCSGVDHRWPAAPGTPGGTKDNWEIGTFNVTFQSTFLHTYSRYSYYKAKLARLEKKAKFSSLCISALRRQDLL